MAHDPLAGVINPFALTEHVLGRRVDWSKVADPAGLVENTLKVKRDELFDAKFRAAPFALADLHPDSKIDVRRPPPDGPATRTPTATSGVGTAVATSPLTAVLRDSLTGVTAMAERDAAKLLEVLAPMSEVGDGVPWTPASAVWVDKGDFFEDGTEFADPVQGALGDCYFISALSSVAWARPYAILERSRQMSGTDFGDQIAFASGGTTNQVEVTEKVPVRNTDMGFIYARSSDAGEIWPAVYEKAYAKWRTGNTTDQPPYDPLSGGDMVKACCEIVPGLTGTYLATASKSADDLWQAVRANSVSMRTVNPMVAWTYATGDASPDKIKYDGTTGVVGWHAYSVLGWAFVSNTKYIVLRNPWGQWEGKVDVLAGTWQAYDISFWKNVPLNAGGVFAMKAETFKKYYAGLGFAK